MIRIMTAAAAALVLTGSPMTAPAQQAADEEQAPAADAPEAGEVTEAPATEPVDTPFVRAHDVAMARIGQNLSHEHVATLNLLAYAAVAANVCADLAMDEGQVYAALTEASHDHFEANEDADAEAHKDFSLIACGVLTGLMLEDAVADEAAFCADAVAYAQATGDEGYLVQTSEAVLFEPEEN